VKFSSLDVTKDSWDQLVYAVIGGSVESEIPSAPLQGIYTMCKPGRNSVIIELWFGKGTVRATDVARALSMDPGSIIIKGHPITGKHA
jgi:hypothetical protein